MKEFEEFEQEAFGSQSDPRTDGVDLRRVGRPRTLKRLLALVAEGRSNAEIGEYFGCSGAAIEKDLKQAYQGLGCKATAPHLKRVEAVGLAFAKGLL